jgi:Conserved TM helix
MNNFMQDMFNVLKTFYQDTMQFLPNLLAAIIIIAAGWIVAVLLKAMTGRILKMARFDQLCDRVGCTQLLAKADIQAPPSELTSKGIFWLILVAFLMSGLGALGLDAMTGLVAAFFGYLPRIFAAMLILLAGFLFGNFLARAAVLAAVNAGISGPHLVGGAVRALIGILAFAMALNQLQIASNIVTAAFTIMFGALMLGMALAFGLGGRDAARQMIEERLLSTNKKDRDEFSHI